MVASCQLCDQVVDRVDLTLPQNLGGLGEHLLVDMVNGSRWRTKPRIFTLLLPWSWKRSCAGDVLS